MLPEKVLKEIMDSKLFISLGEEARVAVHEEYKQILDQRKRASEDLRGWRETVRKAEENEKKRLEDEKKELLGLNIGEWAGKVPNNRRFVLAMRYSHEYIGTSLNPWIDDDAAHWREVEEYCPVDILRGYTAPYFKYYGGKGAMLDKGVSERLLPAINAKDDEELAYVAKKYFNFFPVEHPETEEFAICEFRIDESGHVVINGFGEARTLALHQGILKSEFKGV